ncbi:MAG: 2-hydroxyacyl-CoA dehydratase, partial [Thermodesulfobacteriota bacterium]|nr:2-hydroxyacyl-CoA dehydratase [Thermodesulfobacteriota bacterium]
SGRARRKRARCQRLHLQAPCGPALSHYAYHIFTTMNMLASSVPAGCDGLTCSPYFFGQVMDKAEHSKLVREFLKEVEAREPDDDEVRVMIVGQTSGYLQLIELLDSLGAKVVVDESCFGMRYFWDEVQTDGDPLEAIVSRYVERLPCPVKDGSIPRRRVPFIMNIAQEYEIELALLVTPAFCDPHGYDNAVIRQTLLDKEIKVLELGVDFPLPLGQFRTRIEATLETIQLI